MRSVLLIRPDRNDDDAEVVRALGMQAIVDPFLEVTPTGKGQHLAQRLLQADVSSWLVMTSPRAWAMWQATVPDLTARVRAALAHGMKIAVVGESSAAAIPFPVQIVGSQCTGASLAAELPDTGTAFLPVSAIAHGGLSDGLEAKGWQIFVEPVYDTTIRATTPHSVEALVEGKIAAVVVRSPSAVRALAAFAPQHPATVFAVGPTTAAAAREQEWNIVEVCGKLHSALEEWL